jgi:hypothetical protein
MGDETPVGALGGWSCWYGFFRSRWDETITSNLATFAAYHCV